MTVHGIAPVGSIGRLVGRSGSRSRVGREDEAFSSIAEFLGAFMWQADATTLAITFMTKGVKDVTGHAYSKWIGPTERWAQLIDAEDRDAVVECLRAVASDGHDRQVECRLPGPDGGTVWLRHVVRSVEDGSGGTELWAVATDITADKIAEAEVRVSHERLKALSARAAELKKQALHDALTGLPNRTLFEDRLDTALRAARRSGAPLGVLLMDLDRFKQINDTQGHQAGDAVLKKVALRLRIAMRAQDTPARIGGDEFAGLLPNTDTGGAVRVAQRITRAFEDPMDVGDRSERLGVSVGIALYPGNGLDGKGLLAQADAAMYQAKASGGGYALAAAAGTRRKRRRARKRQAAPRRMLQLMIGVATALILAAGAMVPVARQTTRSDPATRLDAAAAGFTQVVDDRVGAVVASVEKAIEGLSLNDMGRAETAATLDHLSRVLVSLRATVPPSLQDRVERLLATIESARTVAVLTAGRAAGLSRRTASPVARVPSVTAPMPAATPTVEVSELPLPQ